MARCLGSSGPLPVPHEKDDATDGHGDVEGDGEGEDEGLATTLTLAGISAALGALFPSPVLAVLLVLELRIAANRGPSGSSALMQFTVTNGVAATASWSTYSALLDKTWLTAQTLPLAV